MQPKTIKLASLLLLTCSLSISVAVAQERGRIFYHEPIEEIAHEGDASVGENAREYLVFQSFGRQFDLRLRANKGLLRFRSKNGAVYLKGTVSGDVKSWVRLTRNGTELSGMIRDAGDIYIIEPRNRVLAKLLDPAASADATNIIYRLADSEVPLDDLACATVLAPETGTSQAAFDALMSELSATPTLAAQFATDRVTIGILGDHQLHELLAPDTEAEILDRLNIVDGIFSEALGIEISVADITVFQDENTDPFGTSRVAKTLLDDVRIYRTSNQLDLGLTQLITGRDLAGKTAGLAYVGQNSVSGVCTDTGAAITERGSSVFISALLIAHEIGHNMGAGHDGENKSSCESEPETYLMAPVINGNDEFSTCSIQVMQALADNASCINVIPNVDLVLNPPAGGANISVPLGGEFDLSFEVSNVGSDTAIGVVANLDVPEFFSLLALTVDGGVCSAETARCVIDRLAAGATSGISATLTANTLGSYTIGLDVSTPDDRDVTTNSRSASITVEALPDLRVTISGPSSLEAGQTDQASILVENNSAVIASDVRVDVSATNGLDFEISNASDGSCSAATCTIASLPGSASLRINLDVTGIREGAMSLTADSSANENDAAPVDNRATHAVSVVTPVTAPTSTSNSANTGGGGGGGIMHWAVALLLLLTAVGKRRFYRDPRVSPSPAEMQKYLRLRPR